MPFKPPSELNHRSQEPELVPLPPPVWLPKESIGVIAEAEGVSVVVKEGKGGGGSFFLFSGLNGNIGKSGREDFNFDDLRIVRC